MRKIIYILLLPLLALSCQKEEVVASGSNPAISLSVTRSGGGWAKIDDAYDPVADTLYMVATQNGKSDTSIYTCRQKAADTIYASEHPFYYEDVKNATFSIFGYGNVGYETAGRLEVYPDMDQHYDSIFQRNNYVRTENIKLSRIDESEPMSASNHMLSATLHPQFTLIHVRFSSNGCDDIIDSVIFLSDKGDIIPNVYISNTSNYRAIIDPDNVRPPLSSGEIPTEKNALVKFVIRRQTTGEKMTIYAGYTTDEPIHSFKGKKITIYMGFIGEELMTTSYIEPWNVAKCTGIATYIR